MDDRQFVTDSMQSAIEAHGEYDINHARVRAINDVGHLIGMETIAEYVENDAILEIIRDLGVDYAQGNAVGSLQPLQG